MQRNEQFEVMEEILNMVPDDPPEEPPPDDDGDGGDKK